MKVLLLGSGAAIHAMAWKVMASPQVETVHCAPGNAGTALLVGPAPFAAHTAELAQWAFAQQVDLTAVQGMPEWAETLAGMGLPVLGVGEVARQALLHRQANRERWQAAGLRCPEGQSFCHLEAAERYLVSRPLPLWIRPENATQREAVRVVERLEAFHELERFFSLEPDMGACIEEDVPGREISLALLCDGEEAVSLGVAHPYDYRYDGDSGPLTEGMGGYMPYGDYALEERLFAEVGRPVVRALAAAGLLRPSFLQLRIVLSPQGMVLRDVSWDLDDLHAALFLACCGDKALELLHAAALGHLKAGPDLRVERAAVGVVMAVEGYPGLCPVGLPLRGAYDATALVFHHATRLLAEGEPIASTVLPAWLGGPRPRPLSATRRVVTAGGRVLVVVGVGDTIPQARERAYQAVAQLEFEHCAWRRDIAAEGEPVRATSCGCP